METAGPLCHLIDGRPYRLYIDPCILRKALRFEPQEGDIVLVTFPRSGTHWVQQIIQLIVNRGESVTDFREFSTRAPIIEIHGDEMLSRMAPPRLMRTHLPLGRFPYRKQAKYVYVARNPWDCAVSRYRIVKDLPALGMFGSFDEFVDLFLEGKTGWGDYFSHVLSGYNLRKHENVLFTTYEELKLDTPGTISKLAHFLGLGHGKAIEENPSFLKAVLEKSSMDYMKRIFNASPDTVAQAFANNPKIMLGIKDDSKERNVLFLRHGEVGGWKQMFTKNHLIKFETRIADVFRDTDIMSLWKDEWTDARTLLNE